MADGWITIGTRIETKTFDKQIQDIEGKIDDLEKQVIYFEKLGLKEEAYDASIELEKAKNKMISLRQQQEKVNSTGLKNANKELSKFSSETGNAIKKIGKLAFSVISVASAYRLVRQASSTLAQYDEQYASNLEYIRYLIAEAIAPALKYIVNLAGQLITYVNYLLNAWFGIQLISKNSAKNFTKMSSSAKELKKTLQSTNFDEMNVLSDTSSGTSAGGVTTPTIDASNFENLPKWIKLIGEYGDVAKNVILGIGSAIAGLKLADLIKNLGLIEGKLNGIQKIGIIGLIYSTIQLIINLIDYFEKLDGSLENNGTSWFDFGNIIKYIGLVILSLSAIILSVPTAVAGAVILIVGILIKYWDKIKGWLETAFDWLTNAQKNIRNAFIESLDGIGEHFGVVGQMIVGFLLELINWIIEIVKGVINIIKNLLDGLFTGIKQIFDGILLIFKGDFKNGFINILKGIVNVVIGILNALISGLNAIIYPIRLLIAEIGKMIGKNWTVESVKIPLFPKLASGAIINQPGRGIPVAGGRAMAGESGAEGIIPLTDSQAMETLGEAIGRYITINANITNTMNGRVISRQLQQIQNDRIFAYNT